MDAAAGEGPAEPPIQEGELIDRDGLRVEVGSKVRILDRERNSIGVPQAGFVGRIARVDFDKKGKVLLIVGSDGREQRVRQEMIERRVFRPRTTT